MNIRIYWYTNWKEMEIKDSLGELKSNILYTKFVSSSPTNPCKTKFPSVLHMLNVFQESLQKPWIGDTQSWK